MSVGFKATFQLHGWCAGVKNNNLEIDSILNINETRESSDILNLTT